MAALLPARMPLELAKGGAKNDSLIPNLTAQRRPATRQAADPAHRDNRGRGALGGRTSQRAARVRRRTRVASGSSSRAPSRGRDRGGLSPAWQFDDPEGGLR